MANAGPLGSHSSASSGPTNSGITSSHPPIPPAAVMDPTSPSTSTPPAAASPTSHLLAAAARGKDTWDPLACREWDRESITIHATNRIKKDLAAFYADPPVGMFVSPDDANLCIVHALVVGPDDTPYEGGFFYFLIRFPPDYPFHPPRVRLMTTDGGQVRFNPNYYADGKVCLSILGTWSGPAWTGAQTLTSVLLSIQSLMSTKPYHNEPGYEQEIRPGDSDRYNQIISYETLRVAVCQALEMPQGVPEPLIEVMRATFVDYYVTYHANARDLLPHNGCTINDPHRSNKGTFKVEDLVTRLKALWHSVSKEPEPLDIID